MTRSKEEIELLNKLNIEDFRHLKAEHALELASSLKELSPEAQLKIIDQIPNFSNFALSAISTCRDEIHSVIQTNNEEALSSFESYDVILSNLQNMLDADCDLSFDEKMNIIDQMAIISDKKAELHNKERDSRDKNLNKLLGFCGFCIAAFVGILGVNIRKD